MMLITPNNAITAMASRKHFAHISQLVSVAAAFCLMVSAVPASATDWYVSPNGSNSYNGKSPTYVSGTTGPWATIAKACSYATFAQAGDTVHVLPGTYVSSKSSVVSCSHSGTAGKPILIKGEGVYPNLTKIINDGTTFSIVISGSYQTWTNFEVTTSAAVGSLTNINSTNTYDCIFGTPGGTVAAPATAPLTNIIITGNVIHGCGGNGVDFFNSDYITISKNTIYGNANTTNAAYDSGITILGAADSDASTGYKIIIDSNVIYGNSNVPHCAAGNTSCLNVVGDSDGNGIILDSSEQRYDTYTSGLYPGIYGPAYHGRTLVENNLVFGNGGKCIHAYRTAHVDILNNTCYKNMQDPYYSSASPAEIDSSGGYSSLLTAEPDLVTKLGITSPSMSAGDTNVFNNSITANYAPASQHTGAIPGSCISFNYTNSSSQALNNQCYVAGGSPSNAVQEKALAPGVTDTIDPSVSTSLYVAAPLTNPSLDPTVANFHPSGAIPLILSANNSLGYIPYDIAGNTRSATAMTLGAYEQ